MTSAGAWTGLVVDERYHLTRWLGQGAFGSVYEAEHRVFGSVVECVAVKLIHASDDAARAKILGEMRALAALSHPHLIGFRTSGIVQNGPLQHQVFLVCELAKSSLETYLETQHFMTTQAAQLAREMALALQYLGKRKIVHRDLKPANILRVYSGDVLNSWVEGNWKIADFGLARALETQTHISGVAGTLSYLAPEAARGHVAPCNDWWALGALLQESLCGRLPFSSHGAPLQMLERIARDKPFIETNLPSPLREIIAGCLEIDAAKRWGASEVLAALDKTSNVAVAPSSRHLQVLADNTANAHHSTSQVLADDVDNAIHVGPSGYHSIAQAVLNAPDGATIRIACATYCETLVLDKTLHLIGEDGTVIEGSAGNVFKIVGGQGSIRNCEIRGVASRDAKRFHAMSFSSGNWTLRDCSVSCDTLCAIVVSGTAQAEIEGCRLHQALDGLQITQQAQCHIRASRLEHNRRRGLFVASEREDAISLESCALEQNAVCGAKLESGGAQFQKCTLSNNGGCGIELETPQVLADASASTCTLHIEIVQSFFIDNKQHGVRADRNATGRISQGTLSGNRFGAWDVARRSSIERSGNRES